MSENEKKHDSHSCCCCQSWKAIFITITLLAIGAVIGHKMTMHCGHMRGLCGGYDMRTCWDRGGWEREGGFEQKGWFGHKADMGKCKPGCTCPMCSKKAADLSEPNKAGCPMMDKKEGKAKKD